ncbi:glutamine amidotransferase-related protein [Thalassotalea aquiviva]|uniref:glutamine amidotransferase-related protein n=1 Tax=Thalassotalea aquiviva TaxID=3242415 RepID=UPI00352A95B5
MKVGVLLCDHVQEHLQPQHGDYSQMFESLLLSVDPKLQITFYDVTQQHFPISLDECDVYISTGSKYGVNESHSWIDNTRKFIKLLFVKNKGFAGICFGHQLIAKALGGKVEKSANGWGIGVAKTEIINPQDWMIPFQPQLKLAVSHQDQVVRLPPNCQVLMSSTFCPYAMIQVDKHFLGLQGHPEFSKQYLHDLMLSRHSIIPKEPYQSGIKSLELSLDGQLVMGWVIDFLKSTLIR